MLNNQHSEINQASKIFNNFLIILWEILWYFTKKSDAELFLMIFIEAYINSIELNSDIYERKTWKSSQGEGQEYQTENQFWSATGRTFCIFWIVEFFK